MFSHDPTGRKVIRSDRMDGGGLEVFNQDDRPAGCRDPLYHFGCHVAIVGDDQTVNIPAHQLADTIDRIDIRAKYMQYHLIAKMVGCFFDT